MNNDIQLYGDASDRVAEPDAHGQAALLLAESILHVLVENGVLSNADAIDAVRTTMEVKAEATVATGESRERMEASLNLLALIRNSFANDLN